MQTPKKFSSFSNQVSWISDEKEIRIKDREYAEEMLRQIGYFPLMGGYKHLFRISNLLPGKDFLEFKRKLIKEIDRVNREVEHISEVELLNKMGFSENWKSITKYHLK